jgi:hypothetical protein
VSPRAVEAADAAEAAARSSRAVVVVVVLATACLVIFALAAALLLAPKPADPLMRWSPPVRDPLPAAVAGREPLPFCGVAEGGDEAFVDRCLQQAMKAHQPAEAAIVGTSDLGQRVQILRLFADGSAEVFVHGDLKTEGHDGWLTVRCTGLKVEETPRFVVSPEGCGPATPV